MKVLMAFVFIMATFSMAMAEVRPKTGDYVCWAKAKESPPVMGWHPYSQDVAEYAAMDLCNREFGNCQIEYCEKVK